MRVLWNICFLHLGAKHTPPVPAAHNSSLLFLMIGINYSTKPWLLCLPAGAWTEEAQSTLAHNSVGPGLPVLQSSESGDRKQKVD